MVGYRLILPQAVNALDSLTHVSEIGLDEVEQENIELRDWEEVDLFLHLRMFPDIFLEL